jgi:hypothetical protein
MLAVARMAPPVQAAQEWASGDMRVLRDVAASQLVAGGCLDNNSKYDALHTPFILLDFVFLSG